jgi:hypothetical protein
METATIKMIVDESMAAEIERRADSMHLSAHEYCGLVLNEWLADAEPVELNDL